MIIERVDSELRYVVKTMHVPQTLRTRHAGPTLSPFGTAAVPADHGGNDYVSNRSSSHLNCNHHRGPSVFLNTGRCPAF